MLGIDTGLLHSVLEEIERASREHAVWRAGIERTVACQLTPAPGDLAEGAHRKCGFGEWYYRHPPPTLRDHPSFVAMENEHRRLHDIAARMLRTTCAGNAVAAADFDEFQGASEQLALELDSLRHEIESALANRDALTGAHRRVDLLPELRESLELVRRNVQSCCLAFMDLDRFKPINDTHGHRLGDEVLANAVAFVTEHLRPFDKLYRYGGDEFLISMPGADLDAGRAVVERMRRGLAEAVLARDREEPIRVTASFGVALLEPDLSVEEAIDHADMALLAAKAAGRNRVCTWDPAATTATMTDPWRVADG